MKKNKYMLAVSWFLAIGICVFGCKATPKETIVVNKADGALEKTIASSPAPLGKYQAPANWKDTAHSDSGSIKIEIDADIIMPDVQAFPVLRIAPSDITQEQADKFISILMQGKPIFKPRGSQEFTKQELNDLILAVKKHIAEEIEPLKTSNPELYKSALDINNSNIKHYEEMLKTAPDIYVYKPSTGKFESPDTTNIQVMEGEDPQALRNYLATLKSINVVADLGKEIYASLSISKNISGKKNTIIFNQSAGKAGAEFVVTYEINNDLPNQKVTQQDALKKAKSFLAEMGIDYMQPVLLASKPYMVQTIDDSVPIKDYPRYYEFVFKRSDGMVPMVYVNNKFFNFAMAEYNEDWPEEQVVIDIDDTGILFWKWTSPSKVLKTENSNVALLPFGDIQNKLKQQLIISGVWRNEPGVISRTIHINKITLGMACIQAKDYDDEYLMVPVWDVFGYSTIQYKEGSGDPANMNENNVKMENSLGHSYLTINAIDGSIVYR